MARYDSVSQAAIEMLSEAGWSKYGGRVKGLEAAVEAKYPGAIGRARDREQRDAFDRKFIGPVPTWAKTYVKKYGARTVSSLTIRQSRTRAHTSGRCWYGERRLIVTFGIPDSSYGEDERKATVLHEIAHSIALWDAHGDHFYDEWYRMLRSENLYRFVVTCGLFVGVSSLRAAARRARALQVA